MSSAAGFLTALLSQAGITLPPERVKAQGNEAVIEFTADDIKNMIVKYISPDRASMVANFLTVRIEGDRLKVVIRL